jgi:hypothetical protein
LLGLKVGDLVEVRSAAEILSTLDDQGSLDGLPFMPEMLAFCGRRLRVSKVAHKTCDTIDQTGGRRMAGAVHLEDTRCDGSSHGGCQAGCLFYWKEYWLKPATASETAAAPPPDDIPIAPILRGTRQPGSGTSEADIRWRCQTTELKNATRPLPWWNISQYASDIVSGNITWRQLVNGLAYTGFRKLTEIGIGYKLLVAAYNRFQRWRGGRPFPLRAGMKTDTRDQRLDLMPGDWVRVKSHDEILATLDAKNKNRGLSFDAEMVPYCGGKYQVQSRVTRIIEEKTGRMLKINNSCIILRDVYCRGEFSKYRLFCPRAIYSYWRENWLERAEAPADAAEAPHHKRV